MCMDVYKPYSDPIFLSPVLHHQPNLSFGWMISPSNGVVIISTLLETASYNKLLFQTVSNVFN